jgi:hypothetical protein
MKIRFIFHFVLLLLSGAALADVALNADDVKALFSNKTFDVTVVARDIKLQAYDRDDGIHTVYLPWKDKTAERRWWVDGNRYCTSHPRYGDRCKQIEPAGNGVYHGLTEGEHTHIFSNFRDGRSFNK